jgi:predicted nucleic acid-binding protein
LGSVPKYYWDACAWIDLITQADPDRFDRCLYVTEEAEAGRCEIWTSAFTLAEVYKKKCSDGIGGLPQDKDKNFENYVEQEFVTKVQVDVDVGLLARRLLRQYPTIKKPQDAIHVATCLLNNLDELHTFDGSDLLTLDGQIPRRDRQNLRICIPPKRPEDPQKAMSL